MRKPTVSSPIRLAAILLCCAVPGMCLLAQEETSPSQSFDYSLYAKVLEAYVNDKGMVNYAGLKQDQEDFRAFLQSMANLEPTVYASWPEADQIAFYSNAYNALTIRAILNHYPIRASGLSALRYPKNSIRQIDGGWKKLKCRVMGRSVTLDHIEHGILRKDFAEPRIHMAIVCASIGCPILRNEPYTGERLDEQFEQQSIEFLKRPSALRVDLAKGAIHLSPIFKWFGEDFEKAYNTDQFPGQNRTDQAVLNFVAQHASPTVGNFLEAAERKVAYSDYDWSLNEQ